MIFCPALIPYAGCSGVCFPIALEGVAAAIGTSRAVIFKLTRRGRPPYGNGVDAAGEAILCRRSRAER